MTVDDLISKLAPLRGDLEVVVEVSRDYEDYTPVTIIEPGNYTLGLTGGHFKYHKDAKGDDINAVIIC